MRRAVFSLVAVAAACLLGTGAQADVCAVVTLGSADVDFPPGQGGPPNNDANYSLVAIEKCDGTVKGQWQDTWAGGIPIHVKVTCLSIDGDDAWVSGPITKPKGTGLSAVVRLRDRGTSSHDPPDQASWLFWLLPPDFVIPVEPDTCLVQPDLPLYDLNNGQVQIH